ncbi:transcription factor Ovo-like 2 [Striga asiatica]|uniref:Transcription factor Ovo-like 2 n=1 Tax=Striga asiatica TaxID=4170 RepID=A0A5A7RG54_STRAF|nr:transcription factor Ovo-like 2 [Striga asiatica]
MTTLETPAATTSQTPSPADLRRVPLHLAADIWYIACRRRRRWTGTCDGVYNEDSGDGVRVKAGLRYHLRKSEPSRRQVLPLTRGSWSSSQILKGSIWNEIGRGDCGVYVAAYAEYFVSDEIIDVETFDIDIERLRFSYLLYNHGRIKQQKQAKTA